MRASCWTIVLLAILSLWSSSMGLIAVPYGKFVWSVAGDKLPHSLAFFTLSTSLSLALMSTPSPPKGTVAIMSITLAMAISVSNELLQVSSPLRDALSISDMAADAAGYVMGSLLGISLSSILKSQKRRIPRCSQP